MREYHFLVASLPELFFDKKGQHIDLLSYYTDLKYYLHPDDYKSIWFLRLETDNKNLINILSKNNKSFIEGGNYTSEELEKEIKTPENLPKYLIEFINSYKTLGNKRSYAENEKNLFHLFYSYIERSDVNSFIKKWYNFELTLRNIITSIIADSYGRKAENELFGNDELKAEIIYCKSKHIDLSHILPNYPRLVQIMNVKDIIEREKQLDKFRWDYITELSLFNYFTIETIITYTVKLLIIKRWETNEDEKGTNMLNNMINELKNPYVL
jgi:hypothetical protein